MVCLCLHVEEASIAADVNVLRLVSSYRFPVNIIFVCMIGTNVYAMQHVGLGILIVCKNLSNVLTCIGDYVLFGKRYNWNVWASLSVMFASATVGASADKHFTFIGYGWLAANILFTSLYTLLLRGVIGKVKDITAGKPFSDFTLVLYNNALSILPVLLLAIFFDEHKAITLESNLLALSNPSFLIVAAMSGVLGFAISFSSLWFLSQTSATIYSLVGALNKIPIAVLGIFVFNEPTDIQSLGSITLGLGAGILFVWAKQLT
ncbi:hypothetical protein DUNSADRAFT_5397 [Dunaliella salina]|uniref:GDP-mannose transporter n=1 Tax=Dunaliella salina TaxID=3046 RepID=A0ABQ7FUB2_DUNSA|nr:hypothetical protein DUNSADRAFT_5397 [Dunaliella salina]|eukprot:KAF5826011.1 hypothetical protein DUNSADRAFT_5397 [Dunaliella salina]